MALFDLTELASYLQEDLDTASATLARSRAENYLTAELGVDFTNDERTLTRRVPRTLNWQRLNGPLDSVESVTVDTVALTVVDDYEVTQAGVICPAGFGQDVTTATDWCTLVIAYTNGYTTIPGELHDWGLYLAGVAYARGGAPGVRSISVDGVTETYSDDAPGSTALVLPKDVLKSLKARYGSASRVFGSVLLR